MKIRNNIYKAGVLLLAVMMFISVIPTVTADTSDREDEMKLKEGISNEIVAIKNDLKFTGMGLPYGNDPVLGTFADTLFEQLPHTPNDGWSAGTSDAGLGYNMHENFWGLTGDITDLNWWGLVLIWTGSGWTGGNPSGMEFDMEFYDSDPNVPGQPSNLIESFTVSPTATATGDSYAGYESYLFEVTLPDSVSLSEGWVAIQSSSSPSDSVFLWMSAQTGDSYSYQAGGSAPDTYYDRAIQIIGGGNGGNGDVEDCIPDACDFEVVSINNVLDESRMNSLPQILNVTIANNGMIPIGELKILADVYEKICGDTYEWCDDLEKDKYDPRFDSDNENWTTFDDPADDADDEGDTFVLQTDEFHSGSQAYRCTAGKYRSTADEDVYVGRSAAIQDDALIWEPADVNRRNLVGAAGATFSFWHKTTGEFTTDEDGNVIPIDYGWIQYSLDDGATWNNIALSDFVAYDNPWEQWQIKFINTAANGGHYDTVCDAMQCNPDDPRTVCIEEDFTDVGATFLKIRFNWHVNPCNQFEGWYIDDACFERVDEYSLELVHQTHEIIDLDACIIEDYEFPLAFDPEPDTWYQLCVYGQVFQPVGCEANLSNNELCVQFQVTDIHDVACVGITGPNQLDGSVDNNVPYEVTVKNVGTFAESSFPVDLKVARSMSELLIDDDFETEPGAPWSFYYFTGSDPTVYFQWTEGYDNIVGPRSKLPGEESLIAADLAFDFPMLKPNMGSLMTDDEIYDFSDLKCGESATLDFSAKWAIPANSGGACMLIHPTEGPDSAYWWIINFGAWNPASDSYQNDWVDYSLNLYEYQESFAYEAGGQEVLPPIEFGFGLITNPGLTDLTVDTPLGPWGGFMLDNIQLNHVYQDSNAVVVDTKYVAVDDVLEVGEEETIELWWNDTDYCNYIIIGDTQLPTDVNPENDLCCTTTNITSVMTDFTDFQTADLTCCLDESLWHLCTSRPPMDDTFYWCGSEETGFYEPNMDDSLIGTIDLSSTTAGAVLTFDTYYKIEAGWDFGYVSVRDGSALYDNDPNTEPPAWIQLGVYTGYQDWHIETLSIPDFACSEHTQIRFRFVSDEVVQDEGWYIDDVCITTVPILVSEDFEDGVPPSNWEEVVYSGTGHWEGRNVDGTWRDPYGASGQYAIADSDGNSNWVFNVGLRTPKLDLTDLNTVTLSCGISYENFAGYDQAEINVYSDAGFEEQLAFWDTDQGDFPFTATLDVASYASVTDVQIEFLYNTNGNDYLWFYSVDNVEVNSPDATGDIIACDGFEGGASAFTWEATQSCAGNFWEETNELLYGFTDDLDGDDLVWHVHDYPDTGVGLNNAIWTAIDLTDPALIKAVLEFGHQWIMEPGCAAYIEISTDYDPADCMGISDAEWITYYEESIPAGAPDGAYAGLGYPSWQMEQFDLTPYLGETIYLRFRFTTPGDGMYVSDLGGWMVDGFQMFIKEQVFTDETPPVTTLVFDDLTGTVSLFAYDPAGPVSSGVCVTYYEVDGGSTQEYTDPFTLDEGVHTVEYWSVDCAGNEESHKTSPDLVVDTTPPTVEITAPEDALYLFGTKLINLKSPIIIGKITIIAEAEDEGSGIKLVTFDVDGDSGYDATAPYEYTYKGMKFGQAEVTVTAYDEAGLSAQATKEFKIFSLGLI